MAIPRCKLWIYFLLISILEGIFRFTLVWRKNINQHILMMMVMVIP